MQDDNKIYVVPTTNNIVERVLVNAGIEYHFVKNLSAELIYNMPRNSILFWDYGCFQLENEDLNEIDLSLENEKLWLSFFKKNNKLVLQPYEDYKLLMPYEKNYANNNILKKYVNYKSNIIFLTYGEFYKINFDFVLWSISPLEYPLVFMPFDYFENDYQRTFDFCLLSNFKSTRPYRKKFVSYLKKNSNLLNEQKKYISSEVPRDINLTEVNHNKANTFVPLISTQKNSYLEIVLETNDGNGFTLLSDKIIKSIISKTPFIVIADPCYYKMLHNLGFRTFSSVIDESWANLDSSEEKWELILNTLNYIETVGYKNFYKRVEHILEHNFNKCRSILFDNIHNEQKRILDFLKYCEIHNYKERR